jgi:hypothetical protein
MLSDERHAIELMSNASYFCPVESTTLSSDSGKIHSDEDPFLIETVIATHCCPGGSVSNPFGSTGLALNEVTVIDSPLLSVIGRPAATVIVPPGAELDPAGVPPLTLQVSAVSRKIPSAATGRARLRGFKGSARVAKSAAGRRVGGSESSLRSFHNAEHRVVVDHRIGVEG